MQLQLFANLQANINQRLPFQLPGLKQNLRFQTMLGLANLARNCCIQNYSQLVVVQQLTVLLSRLADFRPPISYLAALDRTTFRKECSKVKKNWHKLQDMVVGIYPCRQRTKQVEECISLRMESNGSDDETVGNPNWKLTRKIINAYYSQAPKEEKECIQVLLALPQLRNSEYRDNEWRILWTQLYLMANIILTREGEDWLQSNQNKNEFDQIRSAISKELSLYSYFLQDSNENVQTKITVQLISLITSKFIFKEQADFTGFVKLLPSLKQQKFPSPYFYLFTHLLLKDLFHLCGQIQASNHCEGILNEFKKGHSQADNIVLKSYLMNEKELPDYLYTHGLIFWNSGLNEQVCQGLAQKYFLNCQKFGEQFPWVKVFEQLSTPSLKLYIFNAQDEQWIVSPWAQQFIQTCNNSASTIVKKIYQGEDRAQIQQIQQNLVQFCSQWSFYTRYQERGIENALSQVEDLLTFKSHLSTHFRSSLRFPQNNAQKLAQIYTDYLRFVLERNEVEQKYGLLLSPEFAHNLSLADKQDFLDEFWGLWAEILIQRDSTLEELLKIQNRTEEQSFQEQEQRTNDRLQLSTV